MNRKKWKKFLRVIFGRTTFVALFLLIQILVLLGAFKWLGDHIFFVYGGFTLLSAVVVIYILNQRQNPIYQLAWVIPVLVFPVFGAMFYIYLKLQVGTRRLSARLEENLRKTAPFLKQNEMVMERLMKEDQKVAHLAGYMGRFGGYPVYDHTYAEYFPLGDLWYPKLLEELEKAREYIFMEYFIVEEGKFWDSVLEVLARKAGEGVEVRFMYDGMGCLTLLPHHYPRQLERMGICCKIFSPVKPALSSYQNNRDHRKITVIDGHTAFTGGINLADEYINETVRFGHWKDTAVMLKGEAVWNLTVMFLQMWSVITKMPLEFSEYMPHKYHPEAFVSDGFIHPYCDTPLDDEIVGEDVYLNMINRAEKYVYICTPYLIIDNEMMTALCLAAKSGVDIRIMTPGIPDKKMVFLLTQSYYEQLIESGVKIYEYQPGFLHAKSFVCDDELAVIGSINMDYRSLYLHFENGVWLYRNRIIEDMREDYLKSQEVCRQVTLDFCRNRNIFVRAAQSVLRLFAPML